MNEKQNSKGYDKSGPVSTGAGPPNQDAWQRDPLKKVINPYCFFKTAALCLI